MYACPLFYIRGIEWEKMRVPNWGQVLGIKKALRRARKVVVGDGFEPSNSERSDLQSDAVGHFAIPPFPLKEELRYSNLRYCLL
jgi:hypothetical protein